MKYTVDEEKKTIQIEGSPSIFNVVELMQKRFPNDEWKEYVLVPTVLPNIVGGSVYQSIPYNPHITDYPLGVPQYSVINSTGVRVVTQDYSPSTSLFANQNSTYTIN